MSIKPLVHRPLDAVKAAVLYDAAMIEWATNPTGNAVIRFMDWCEKHFPDLLTAAFEHPDVV